MGPQKTLQRHLLLGHGGPRPRRHLRPHPGGGVQQPPLRPRLQHLRRRQDRRPHPHEVRGSRRRRPPPPHRRRGTAGGGGGGRSDGGGDRENGAGEVSGVGDDEGGAAGAVSVCEGEGGYCGGES